MAFIKTGTPHPFKKVYGSGEEENITQLCENCNRNNAEFHVGNKKVCKDCRDLLNK